MTDTFSDPPIELPGDIYYGVFVLGTDSTKHKLFISRKQAEEWMKLHKGECSHIIHTFELTLIKEG